MRCPCRTSRTSSSFFLVMKKAATASATITQTEFVPGPFRRFTDGCCKSLPTEHIFYSTHRERGAVRIIVCLWSTLRRLNLKRRQTIIQPVTCRNYIYTQLIYRSKCVYGCPAQVQRLSAAPGRWWVICIQEAHVQTPVCGWLWGTKWLVLRWRKCFFFYPPPPPHHILWKNNWKAVKMSCVSALCDKKLFSSPPVEHAENTNRPSGKHISKKKNSNWSI